MYGNYLERGRPAWNVADWLAGGRIQECRFQADTEELRMKTASRASRPRWIEILEWSMVDKV